MATPCGANDSKESRLATTCDERRQRRVPGVADSPHSLMEGAAGDLCFLLDLISPDTSAFPGWEL